MFTSNSSKYESEESEEYELEYDSSSESDEDNSEIIIKNNKKIENMVLESAEKIMINCFNKLDKINEKNNIDIYKKMNLEINNIKNYFEEELDINNKKCEKNSIKKIMKIMNKEMKNIKNELLDMKEKIKILENDKINLIKENKILNNNNNNKSINLINEENTNQITKQIINDKIEKLDRIIENKELIPSEVKINDNTIHKPKTNTNVIEQQYVYILQEREFIKTNENIYKIGKTKQLNLTRFKQYPKGSMLLMQMSCFDCDILESKIIEIFKIKYIQRTDIGTEYFEGEKNNMISDIYSMNRDEKEPVNTNTNTIPIPKTKLKQDITEFPLSNSIKFMNQFVESNLYKLFEKWCEDNKKDINSEKNIKESNLYKKFLNTRESIKEKIKGTELYNKYIDWCKSNGERQKNNIGFGTDITSLVNKKKKSDGIYYILTI